MNQIFLGIYVKDMISLTHLINTFLSVILLIETSQSEILASLQTPIEDGTLSLWLPINASLIHTSKIAVSFDGEHCFQL